MVTVPVHPSFSGMGIIVNDTQNDTQKLTERQRRIREMVLADCRVTTKAMADAIGVSPITIIRDMEKIGIRWQGHPKTGHWKIVAK